MRYISAGTLRQIGFSALRRAGVRPDIIHPVIDGLVWTSLRGVDSHGVRLLPHYVEGAIGGRLNPSPSMVFNRVAAATGTLDADDTFGHAAGVEAMKHAIELARETGIGAVSVRNSSHCGALSYFGHAAAEQKMIGVVFTHATARVMSPGSNRAFFGNNPLCFVAPMRDEGPFSFDAATTGTTFNAVKAAAATGDPLPPGLVADGEGNGTTDPNKAEQLLPIGDYKGFGLSMVVDILCALLSGMPSGNRVSQMFGEAMNKRRQLGHFFCAFRPNAFNQTNDFQADLQELANRVRAEPANDTTAQGVMVPGDPEKRAWEQRSHSGIPVPAPLYARLQRIVR